MRPSYLTCVPTRSYTCVRRKHAFPPANHAKNIIVPKQWISKFVPPNEEAKHNPSTRHLGVQIEISRYDT